MDPGSTCIGHCVNTKGCTKSPTSSLLPSGTRVWIERNGSLIVERTSNQRNATALFQFLFEDSLRRRRICTSHFTVSFSDIFPLCGN